MFKNRKIGTKLFLGTGSILALIILIGFIVISNIRSIQENEQRIVLLQQKQEWAQDIVLLDEVLTQSTRNYNFTGDESWKRRYETFGAKLDDTIKAAVTSAESDNVKILFKKQDEANLKLVDMELVAHDLVKEGKMQEAIALIDSEEYIKWKEVYSETIEQYLSISKENLASIFEENETDLYNMKKILYVLFGVVFLLGIGVAMVLSVTISRSISKARNAAVEIARGNMDVEIDTSGKDEIAELLQAVDHMRESLKVVMEEYEKKVTS